MLLENISIGTYYPGTSLLHRLQARTKLLVMLMLVVGLVIANRTYWDFTPYFVALALVIAGIACSGITFREMGRRLWLLVVFVVIGIVIGLPSPVGASYNGRTLLTFPPLILSPDLVSGLLISLGLLVIVYLLLLLLPLPALRHPVLRRWLKRIPWIVLLTVIFLYTPVQNALATQPNNATTRLAFLITYDDFWSYSIFLGLFLILYPSSLLLTMTTSPVALIEGLTMLMTPLRWLRLPVDDFALMTLIALRFIPTLIEEVEQLVKAQTARGASFSSGSLRERVQSLLSLFIPFLRNTLRRASELATALDARGYQAEGRQTRLYEKRFAAIDYLVLLLVSGLLLVALII